MIRAIGATIGRPAISENGTAHCEIVRLLVQRILIGLLVQTVGSAPQIDPQATFSASIFWNLCSWHQWAFGARILARCGQA